MQNVNYTCDRCGETIENPKRVGMINGVYYGIDVGLRDKDKCFNKIIYTDFYGNTPDLCEECVKEEITGFLEYETNPIRIV